MKLFIYIVGVLLLGIIIAHCHPKIHIPIQEDCTYQRGNPHSNYHIWWNTTYFPGHKISLKIEAHNKNNITDNYYILLIANDLQQLSDPEYRNFETSQVGNFWICTIIRVEKGYEKTPWKMIDWQVYQGKIGQ